MNVKLYYSIIGSIAVYPYVNGQQAENQVVYYPKVRI